MDRIALENRIRNIYDRVRELDEEWMQLEAQADEHFRAGRIEQGQKLARQSENGPRSEARRLRESARGYQDQYSRLV